MNDFSIEISCCLCGSETEADFNLPSGWEIPCGTAYASDAFCPKHSAAFEFMASQCPGCVESWGDCKLWRLFAYSDSKGPSQQQFTDIDRGACPVRTGGTIGVTLNESGMTMEDVDLSEQPSPMAGIALAEAIRDYMKRHSDRYL